LVEAIVIGQLLTFGFKKFKNRFDWADLFQFDDTQKVKIDLSK